MIRMAAVSHPDRLSLTPLLREWAKQKAPDVDLQAALDEFQAAVLAYRPPRRLARTCPRMPRNRGRQRDVAVTRNWSAPDAMDWSANYSLTP